MHVHIYLFHKHIEYLLLAEPHLFTLKMEWRDFRFENEVALNSSVKSTTF